MTLQEFPMLQFGCRTIDPNNDRDEHGTFDHDFDRVLRWSGKKVLKIRRRKNPSFKDIKQHLKNGGSICLGYYWKEWGQEGGHYAFMTGMKRGFFMVVNDHSIPDTTRLRTSKTIRKWLSIKTSDCPIAWFLTQLDGSPAPLK